MALIIGITVLGYIKIRYHYELWINSFFNIDIIVIGLYALWIVCEVKVSHNDVKQEKVVSDHGTREFYAVSQGLTVLSALWFNPIGHTPGIYHLIGFIFFISGICLRIWAIQTLGKYYSHIVRIIDHHKIIDTGPYRLLRHPAYAGMITAHMGIAIFYFNYVTLAVFILLLIPSILIRIIIEEKTLINIEGYAEFSKNRKRIIPYMW